MCFYDMKIELKLSGRIKYYTGRQRCKEWANCWGHAQNTIYTYAKTKKISIKIKNF